MPAKIRKVKAWIEENAEAEPITMKEADLMRANLYDAWNLKWAKWSILLGLFIVGYDYLRRHNIYKQAYSPRRIPSALANFLTPHPPVVYRGKKPRRDVPEELAWLAKRGDSFIYFNTNPEDLEEIEKCLSNFYNRKKNPLQLLRTSQSSFTDQFAIENWWFGRSSLLVDTQGRPESMLQNILELLENRKGTRARVTQTAHLVWDQDNPIPEDTQIRLEQLAARTGVSLLLCRE